MGGEEITQEQLDHIVEEAVATLGTAIEILLDSQRELKEGEYSSGIGRMAATGKALHDLGLGIYYIDEQSGWPLFGGDPDKGENTR
jgi:hypothetical protein